MQAALAAGLAWYLAKTLLGHPQPFFAPISAMVSLGAAMTRALDRSLQVILGVTFGLVVADFLVLLIGTGSVQLAIITALTVGAAVFFGGGPLTITQVSVSAILVVTLEAPTKGVFSPDRLFDAILGISVALAVTSIFPVNPARRIMGSARSVLAELAESMRETSAALETGDEGKAQGALLKVRRTDEQVDGLRESLAAARETARLSPVRRRSLARLDAYLTAAEQLDLAVPNTRVLVRSALRLLRKGGPVPAALPGAVLELSRAVEALDSYLEATGTTGEEVRRRALSAAREANDTLPERHDLPASSLVAQIRSTAVDLMRATGIDFASALDALEEAVDDQRTS